MKYRGALLFAMAASSCSLLTKNLRSGLDGILPNGDPNSESQTAAPGSDVSGDLGKVTLAIKGCPDKSFGADGDQRQIAILLGQGDVDGIGGAIADAIKSRAAAGALECLAEAVTYHEIPALPNGTDPKPALAAVEESFLKAITPIRDVAAGPCVLPGSFAAPIGIGILLAEKAGILADDSAANTAERNRLHELVKVLSQNVMNAQLTGDHVASLSRDLTPGVFAQLLTAQKDCPASAAIISLRSALKPEPRIAEISSLFTDGLFRDRTFIAGDFAVERPVLDTELRHGGLGFDHGGAGILLNQSIAQRLYGDLQDADERNQTIAALGESLTIAVTWAIQEPAVSRLHYTAKLIELLAHRYGASHLPSDRDAMMDKINVSLKPAMLVDWEADGKLDSVPAIAMSDLGKLAATPGRYWNGVDMLGENHAAITLALVEAFIALRDNTVADSGEPDEELATALWRYTEASVDNLVHEVTTYGVTANSATAVGPPLLTALWKIRDVDPKRGSAKWDDAANRLWPALQARVAASPAPEDVLTLSLYLLRAKGVAYVAPN